MAIQRICSIPNCGKRHKGHGFCGRHFVRYKTHGDPFYVVPKELRKKPGRKGPIKHFIDPNWLRSEYITKRRRNADLCQELGCSAPTLLIALRRNGIANRDDRAGAVHNSRRVKFDLKEATRLYVDELRNCDDIGDMFGVHGCSVRRRLRESGIKIRHHNDTKRGKPNHRRKYLDAAEVLAHYISPEATLRSTTRAFRTTAKVILRVLSAAGVILKGQKWARSGHKNPNWNPRLTPAERALRRDTAKQTEWRLLVYRRDRFTCQRCGDDRGGNLNAHHIEAHCQNKKDRDNPDNGITLCKKCHIGFHRKYGYRAFGREQLSEYLTVSQVVAEAKARVG